MEGMKARFQETASSLNYVCPHCFCVFVIAIWTIDNCPCIDYSWWFVLPMQSWEILGRELPKGSAPESAQQQPQAGAANLGPRLKVGAPSAQQVVSMKPSFLVGISKSTPPRSFSSPLKNDDKWPNCFSRGLEPVKSQDSGSTGTWMHRQLLKHGLDVAAWLRRAVIIRENPQQIVVLLWISTFVVLFWVSTCIKWSTFDACCLMLCHIWHCQRTRQTIDNAQRDIINPEERVNAFWPTCCTCFDLLWRTQVATTQP